MKLQLFTIVLAIAMTPVVGWSQGFFERLEKQLNPAEKAVGVPVPPPEPVPATAIGYLGLRAEDVNEPSGGVVVKKISSRSPAEKAGLRVDDHILSVNDAEVKTLAEFGQFMERNPPSTKLVMQIERAGKREKIEAILGERPPQSDDSVPTENILPPPKNPAPVLPPLPGREASTPPSVVLQPEVMPGPAVLPAPRGSLGVTISPITEEARRLYKLSVRSGALVSAIQKGSAADQAGLPLGAAIVAADGVRIERPEDLIGLVQTKGAGEELMLSYYQGVTLFRKTIRLGEAPTELRIPAPEMVSDRPLLRRLERALDDIGQPLIPPPAMSGSAVEFEQLRQEVASLREQVKALEARLQALETKPAGQ